MLSRWRPALAAFVLGGLAAAALTTAPAYAAAPGQPTAVSASARDGEATVSFTPPSSDGGSTITSYTVISSPGHVSASGSSSPITVSGLTDGTAYTFMVAATNSDATGVASQPSAAVTPLAVPSPSSALTLTGTAEVDDTLALSNVTWVGDPTEFAYQWEDCDSSGANCAAIDGATDSTYQVDPLDGGSTIAVEVTATNADDETATYTSEPTAVVTARPNAPVSTSPPTTGTQAGAATRTGSSGNWTGNPTSYTYAWASCTQDGSSCQVVGGDQPSYAPTQADAGNVLYLVVFATNAAGDSVAEISAPSLPVSFAPPPTVTISDPSAGVSYAAGETVIAAYSCQPGAGTTLISCAGSVPDGSPFQPVSGGSFVVTATDSDGQTATHTVVTDVVNAPVGAVPAITITVPANGATYVQDIEVHVSFSCGFSGEQSAFSVFTPLCSAQDTAAVCPPLVVPVQCSPDIFSGGSLNNDFLGQHTFTVTATSVGHPPTTASVTYNVVARTPTANPAATERVVVTRLSQSRSRWSEKSGTKFKFATGADVVVTFGFTRTVVGRRAGGRCVAQTRENHREAACTRTAQAGSMTVSEPSGHDVVAFKGSFNGTKLAPGRYTATVTAIAQGPDPSETDDVGTLHFTIVK